MTERADALPLFGHRFQFLLHSRIRRSSQRGDGLLARGNALIRPRDRDELVGRLARVDLNKRSDDGVLELVVDRGVVELDQVGHSGAGANR